MLGGRVSQAARFWGWISGKRKFSSPCGEFMWKRKDGKMDPQKYEREIGRIDNEDKENENDGKKIKKIL